MKTKVSLFIIFALTVSIFGFGISQDNPIQKDMRSKLRAQKLIDAGINNNIEPMGPGINNPVSVINESFEGATFPPAGWTKLNPDGGTGWNQQSNGTTPVPGFVGGTVTTPVGGGSKVAFMSWNTGGASSNDQWLITPQITNVQSNDSLKFSLRYWPNSYRDSIEVLISTSTPVAANFTTLVFRKNFAVNSPDTNWVNYKFRIGNLVSAGANIYIAFRETVVDNITDGATFSLDLVSTTGVISFANDMAATSVDAPLNISLPASNIAPKATFTNLGSSNQTNIPVVFKITGPVNYTGNSTIASLTSGNSIQVTFPATFNPTAGTYNTTVISNLSTDQNKPNDTIRSTFTVIQPNYGGGGTGTGGYYFANSSAAANLAPSQPGYCWMDTSGSTSLVVNSVASVAPNSGDLDDGYWKFSGLGGVRKIKFFGVAYDSIFIGTNGVICFTNFIPGSGNWNPPAAGLPNPGPGGGVRPGVYPSWNDLNWGNLTQNVNRLSYKVDNTKNKLIVTYDRAPLFAGLATEYATFQVVFDLQADTTGAPNSNIAFNFSNDYTAINIPFLIGIQDPTGANYLQYTFINSSAIVVTGGPFFDEDNYGLTVQFGPNANGLTGNCKSLNLKALIEGFWNGSTTVTDTITVQLRSTVSPYALLNEARGVFDANGNISLDFGSINNQAYYIVVRHRNGLETWSKSGGETWTGASLSFDFTTSDSKAYGNNLTLKLGKYTIYSGDVNQDGIIDVTDAGLVDNDGYNFVSGYVVTDVNGDDVVDVSDAAIVDNNSYNFVGVIKP